MEDTKIIYHIDDEETPYLVKLPVLPTCVTLGDFKNALNRPNYKFFFKSLDADFGVVKEEITEDDARLPCFNGKVISWLVSADSSTKSDNPPGNFDAPSNNHVHCSNKASNSSNRPATDGVSPSNRPVEPPSEQEHAVGTTGHMLEDCDTCAETDSVYSGDRVPPLRNFPSYKHGSRLGKFGQRPQPYETSSSLMSSDLESTSFFDSEDESSRFSTATGTTMSSVKYSRHQRRQHNKRRRLIPVRRISEDASSFSSMTDSTMSLNVITVTLNMDTVNFLGISIVGQSNKAGDGGIYVGSIMRGGAVAQDGRIEPGDMILEVNRISFEDMSNDEAVRILREEVQKPGPITLVVAKCWDPSPKDYFTVPRQEPVRPIDPRAWVLHTNAMTGALAHTAACPPFGGPNAQAGMGMMRGPFLPMGQNSGLPNLLPQSLAALNSMPSATNMTSKSLPEVSDPTEHHHHHMTNDARGYRSGGPGSSGGGAGSTKTRSIGEMDPKTGASLLAVARSATSLSVTTDMVSVVRNMLLPDSGLDIRDRIWLKITIPNAFIGSDLVDWLYNHVDGFSDRKQARRYASELLKCGYIRHTVNKNTFSEQCYYVFGDIATALAHLHFDEIDSVSEIGGPAGSRTSNTSHALRPQCYPQLHHVMPGDTNSSGLTSVHPGSHQTQPPSSMFGLMSAQSNLIDCSGMSAGTSVQPGPHYPYPPMLYPASIGVPQSSLVNETTVVPSTLFNPVSTVSNQVRTSNGHCAENVPQSIAVFSHSGTESHTFGLNSVRNPLLNPTTLHALGRNSSSSGSSHSSPSSASSSSSTASSETGHGRKMNTTNPPPSSNGSGAGGAASSSGTTKLSHELLANAPTTLTSYLRHAAPSVQSVSGASSASSASRQNGTGASATGSGSGSARTGRVSSRPPPLVRQPDLTNDTRQRDTGSKVLSSLMGRSPQDKTGSFTDLNIKSSGGSSMLPTSSCTSRTPR